MAQRKAWQTLKVRGGQVVDELKRLLHEGNVRRVVVKQKGRSVAEFPLTVGVVGAVAAPVLAAVGALVALLADCSLDVERGGEKPPTPSPAARGRRGRRPARTAAPKKRS